MNKASIKEHDVKPYFDMEAFIFLSRETRLGAGAAERLAWLWCQWLELLKVREVSMGEISWLAVWLPENVEDLVDETWGKSPSEGYMVNSLAQFMCMSSVQELLPQVADGACAPSPRPAQALREALAGIGIPYKEDTPLLSRRYAVVTHYPYRGGCEICYLQSRCPKGQGQAESAGIVLPGYEREEENKG